MRAPAALLLLLHGSFAAGGAQDPVTLKSSLLEQLRTTHTPAGLVRSVEAGA